MPYLPFASSAARLWLGFAVPVPQQDLPLRHWDLDHRHQMRTCQLHRQLHRYCTPRLRLQPPRKVKQHRLQHLFARGDDGKRAINAGNEMLDYDVNWKDYLWYFEFFDGDTGRGLGASHQCGWTGLIAKIIHDTG